MPGIVASIAVYFPELARPRVDPRKRTADDAPPERRRSRLAYEVMWGTGAAADVLVWTATQFNSRVHLPTSLPATVVREGKLLHAA